MLPDHLIIKKADFKELELCEDREELEETISDLLSDTYGFLHEGFSYRETEDEIIITNINWVIDEEDND